MVQKGKGISTRPAPQSRVKVRTCGYLESGKVVDKHSQCAFTVGEGDVIQGMSNDTTELVITYTHPLPSLGHGGYTDGAW